MKLVVFTSVVVGASAGQCCYEGCAKAPTSCNAEGEYCSQSQDNCGNCGGSWCDGGDPTPSPTPTPTPTPSPPPPAGLKLYCPTADDLTLAYCDEGPNHDKGCPELADGGWTVNGGGGVATKAAYNLLGGYVEYDIDLSNVDNGVNANIYTIAPASFAGSYFNRTNDYCDGAATGAEWCMELDWIEANGHCGGAATIHTIEGPGNDGCTAWGCRVSEHYGNSRFHMKVEHDESGRWTITRDGQVLSGYEPDPSGAWDYIKQMHQQRGQVIYSSEWTGWVPVDDCGTDAGDLYGSSFSISNLKISGSVVQGPEPAECSGTMSV